MMASFFWHGGPLTLYEAACLRSFVKAGAAVRLFSFDDTLHVPAGVELRDARLYAEVSETQRFQQGHHDVSLAAFSDMFRYRLLADAPGWWFDTDVMCLQPVDAFAPLVAKSPGLILGEESPGQVNGAVMHVSDCAIARSLLRSAESFGHHFAWGSIGPRLLGRYCRENRQRVLLQSSDVFYPVPGAQALSPFDPAARQSCDVATRGALTTHLWNGLIERLLIPKDVLPPYGSWLHEQFMNLGVDVERGASLSWKSVERLQIAGNLTRLDRMALATSGFLKRITGVSR